jgi:hypothetical protein
VPSQTADNPAIEWEATRVRGQDPLAERVSKKLIGNETLFTRYGPTRLQMILDEYLWADSNHIGTRQLWNYLTQYLYLPRMKNQEVLRHTIEAGVDQLVANHFAYAGRYNEDTARYEGLILSGGGQVVIDNYSVLVKPVVAQTQVDQDRPDPVETSDDSAGPPPPNSSDSASSTTDETPGPSVPALPRRFYATAEVDPDRAPRDMGKIAEEVLQHLTTVPGAKVSVSVEIAAEIPEGVNEDTQRIVTENCQTLKFSSHGFEDR